MWLLEKIYYIKIKVSEWWSWFSLEAYGKAAKKVDEEKEKDGR